MKRIASILTYILPPRGEGRGWGSLVALCLLCPALLHANDNTENTGALWTEVGVTKALPHNLSVGLDLEHRTLDWLDESSRYNVGMGLNWKLNKHWKFGVGYTFIIKHSPSEVSYKTTQEQEYKYKNNTTSEKWDANEFLGNPYTDESGVEHKYRGYNDKLKEDTRTDESFWRQKHRIYVNVAYTTKFWKTLRITLRERYQITRVPSKTIDRARYRETTVTKYRDPSYNSDGKITSYDEITKYWQEGNVIYSQDITDADNLGTPTDGTLAWLADHDGKYLNTTETLDHEKHAKTLHLLRSKLKFSIDKKGWRWEPYVSVETHNNFSDKMHLDKVRTAVGVDYKITRQHEVGLGYVFNHENDDDGNQNIHAISIGYNFKF